MSTEMIGTHSEQKSDTGVSRKRQIGFYVSGGLFLLVCVAVFGLLPEPPILPLIVTGWFQPQVLGIHQLHETLASALFWAIIAGMAFTLLRPEQMIGALRQSLAILGMMIVILLVSGNLMEPMVMMAVLLLLGGITAALHPARHRLLRSGRLQPWLLGLTVVAAVPLLDYALDHLRLQMGAGAADTHAAVGHWALMSGYALTIIICGLLASLRTGGSRVPAWSTGVMAILFGLAAIVMPTQASGVGLMWGILALVWGLAFIAIAEVTNARSQS